MFMGEDKGGADGRVARHRQLNSGGKNAHKVIMCGGTRRKYESCFREIQFFGECLHHHGGNAVSICKYSERIATKGPIRKDIDQAIAQFSHTISIQWYKMAQ